MTDFEPEYVLESKGRFFVFPTDATPLLDHAKSDRGTDQLQQAARFYSKQLAEWLSRYWREQPAKVVRLDRKAL